MKIKEEEGEEPKLAMLKKRDELYAAAVDIVVREGRGSVSLLQRAWIGYGRAARLVDYMARMALSETMLDRKLVRSSSPWPIGKRCRAAKQDLRTNGRTDRGKEESIRRDDSWEADDEPKPHLRLRIRRLPQDQAGRDANHSGSG